MDKDIKQIGYAVQVGNGLVSSYTGSFDGIESIQIDILNIRVKHMSEYEATKVAEEVNGVVVEIYAREISEDKVK